jgi:transposase
VDETGWREGRQRAWLWTAVTTCGTVFVSRVSRGGKVARELLGERFWGWWVTDRWSAYTWYPTWRRQVCWAHRRRDIAAMIERGGRSRELGAALQAQAQQMFHWWHRVRDGPLAHRTLARYMWPVRQKVERWLEAGQTCGVPKTEGTCWELFKLRRALWTFVRHEGVEPTNNAPERAIRPGVLWRKGSFGTQSAEGSRVVETMLTGPPRSSSSIAMSSTMSPQPVRQRSGGSRLRPYFPSLPTSNRAYILPHSSVPQVNAYQSESSILIHANVLETSLMCCGT